MNRSPTTNPRTALQVFLTRFDGSKMEAAKALDISRTTFYNWLRKPDTIPLEKAILIEKITQRYIMAYDLIPMLKQIVK